MSLVLVAFLNLSWAYAAGPSDLCAEALYVQRQMPAYEGGSSSHNALVHFQNLLRDAVEEVPIETSAFLTFDSRNPILDLGRWRQFVDNAQSAERIHEIEWREFEFYVPPPLSLEWYRRVPKGGLRNALGPIYAGLCFLPATLVGVFLSLAPQPPPGFHPLMAFAMGGFTIERIARGIVRLVKLNRESNGKGVVHDWLTPLSRIRPDQGPDERRVRSFVYEIKRDLVSGRASHEVVMQALGIEGQEKEVLVILETNPPGDTRRSTGIFRIGTWPKPKRPPTTPLASEQSPEPDVSFRPAAPGNRVR